MPPRDEAASVRDTTHDVASWLDRLEFPAVDPGSGVDPARAMREDLRLNFYDTVRHWLGDLRERLRELEDEAERAAPVVHEHVAQAMERIIDATREAAAPEAAAGAAAEEPARVEPARDPGVSAVEETGDVGETVASFRARLNAERQRLAERAREDRLASLRRLRGRRSGGTAPGESAADDAPARAPEVAAGARADRSLEGEDDASARATATPTEVAPARDGIRFRRVDRAPGS